MKTFTIVVETENLGMAGVADLEASLNSLKNQSYPLKKINEVLVIAGSHVSTSLIESLKNKYPWITIKTVDKPLTYVEAKMRGAALSKSDYVIFADSDMRYEKAWLKSMIEASESYDEGFIFSGDTRLKNDTIYEMSLNLTWMVQIQSDKIKRPEPTSFFPLNNFAIKKTDLLQNPIPTNLPLYRNVIPLWEKKLTNKGFKVIRVPKTRGFHAPPSNFIDWLLRMLAYGSDFVAMADFSINSNQDIVETNNIIKRLAKFAILIPWKAKQLVTFSYKIIEEDSKNIKLLPLAILFGLVNIFVTLIGAIIGVFNRMYIYNTVTKHELGRVV